MPTTLLLGTPRFSEPPTVLTYPQPLNSIFDTSIKKSEGLILTTNLYIYIPNTIKICLCPGTQNKYRVHWPILTQKSTLWSKIWSNFLTWIFKRLFSVDTRMYRSFNFLPYARHHNPLLIQNCSWILSIHNTVQNHPSKIQVELMSNCNWVKLLT